MNQDHDLLEMLFDHAPMGMAIIDPDFRLVSCNSTWAQFIKRYTPSTIDQVRPGASLFELEPGTESTLKALFAPALAGEIVQRQAVRLESDGLISYWDVMLQPLQRDGQVIAVLDVSLDATERVRAWEELEERVAQRTAEIEKRRRMAEGLADILRVINSARPLSQILDYIVDQARILSSAEVCVLHHINYARAMVAIEASSGLPDEVADIEGFPLFSSRSDELILERRPVIIEDIPGMMARSAAPEAVEPTDLAVRRWREVMSRLFHAFLAVPLVIQEEVYGSLAFYYSEPRKFKAEEIALAMSLGDQASLAIDNAQLRIRAAESAVTDERNRLARELHDAVTQTLFSASLIAEVLPRLWVRDPTQGAARLEELRELTRGALAEMRTLLLELRPAALIETNLGDLLKQLAVSAQGRARLPVAVETDIPRPLPPEIQGALYRIAQESLNNVIKHAAASQVWIDLRFSNKTVELTISDNGVGFAFADVATHSLGLRIMQERAAKIGAEIEVRSSPGAGSSIRVCCPLPSTPQEDPYG